MELSWPGDVEAIKQPGRLLTNTRKWERKGNRGFKTLSTYDFFGCIYDYCASNGRLITSAWKGSLCLVDRGIGEKRYGYIFSRFPYLIRMGAKGYKLQNLIVGPEHWIPLKIEFTLGKFSSTWAHHWLKAIRPWESIFLFRQVLLSLFSTVSNA
jgi:hypothetical protein